MTVRTASAPRTSTTRITQLMAAGCAAAIALAAGATTAEAAPPGMPPRGKVLLGVEGSVSQAKFNQLTRQRHHIQLKSMSWGQGVSYGARFNDWFTASKSGNYRMMFHLTTRAKRGGQAIAPRGIARGKGDAYLIAASRSFNRSGQIVYVRPMAEMNGHWNMWSAYDANGRSRGASHSTAAYRNAFRRMTLIMRGGKVSSINATLKRWGMPPLRTSRAVLPRSGKVAMVWNPQGEGSPNIRGNQPVNYYPGRRYVDYVGNDLYSIRFRAHWTAHNRLYNQFSAHPFMVVEYAPWGTDDPAFIDRMFRWVRTHPRTKALMYYDGNGSTTFRLARKPKSLARYRANARGTRFRCGVCTSTR